MYAESSRGFFGRKTNEAFLRASIILRHIHLVGKSEGKRPLERPRCWLEDNIRADLREIGWGIVDWIHLVQNREQWRTVVKR
jgi:hypothetical protein